MNKKIYLLSFAAAAIFASCSNEMDEFAQAGSQQGFKVGITVKESAETRLALNDNGKDTEWQIGDKFSLFNVGTGTANPLTATANAAYKTTDGTNFTSENVLFEAKHALVFPLNTGYVQSGTAIEVAPITDGSYSLGNRSVFLSKTLLDITKDGLKDKDGKPVGKNQYGYNKDIEAEVYGASAAFILNLKPVNAALKENDPALTISKVEVIAKDIKPFADKATLATNADGKLVLNTTSNATSKAFVEYNNTAFDTNGTTVRIVTLPHSTATTGSYEIKVHTSYGVVTIDKAAQVTSVKDGKTLIQASKKAELKKGDGGNENAALSFDEEVAELAKRAAAATSQPTIVRDVVVDMKTADISQMEIKNSTQLLAAYRAFEILNKTYAEFTIQGTSFELTKAAVDAINGKMYKVDKDGNKSGVKLTVKPTTITLNGYGTETYNPIPAIDQIKDVDIVLSAGNKWSIDVHAAATANAFASITNKGELQISMSDWNEKTSVILDEEIENDGAIVFAGNVDMPTAISDKKEINDKSNIINAGTITVANDQKVVLKAGANIQVGTITIGSGENSTAILTSYKDTNTTIGVDVTANVYGSLLNASDAKLENAGTINIKDANAGLIITANTGTINVTSKDNFVTVGANTGYIKLPVSSNEFVVSADNMGIANYVVFSGSQMTIKDNDFYVEFTNSATVKCDKNAAKSVKEFNVNSGKMVTIPVNNEITAEKVNNKGIIRVYGTLTYTSVSGADQIYKY